MRPGRAAYQWDIQHAPEKQARPTRLPARVWLLWKEVCDPRHSWIARRSLVDHRNDARACGSLGPIFGPTELSMRAYSPPCCLLALRKLSELPDNARRMASSPAESSWSPCSLACSSALPEPGSPSPPLLFRCWLLRCKKRISILSLYSVCGQNIRSKGIAGRQGFKPVEQIPEVPGVVEDVFRVRLGEAKRVRHVERAIGWP